jgi:flagellin
MAAVLGTNIASVWASRNLQSAQANMSSSVERLSSGLRINRARDDAAGLGVANILTQQINGSNQGIRNLNDGISMVQTAEGAIATATEMAQRIQTLATQGASGALSQDGRKAIVNEVKQLIASINSITTRTKFAGSALLDVADGTAAANKFTLVASNQTTDTVTLANSAFLNIGGGAVGIAASDVDGADASDTSIVLDSGHGFELSKFIGETVYKVDNAGAYTELGTVADGQTNVDTITLAADTSEDIAEDDIIVIGAGQLTRSGTSEPSLLQTAYDSDLTDTNATNASTAFLALAGSAGRYITSLVTQRAELGAMQNQMEYSVNNITELSANLTAAKSRVVDTDYASETATLTKGQILQQAATAMLAQANQMPNVILSLLK